MKQYKLGVLGAGNMGLAIARGAVRCGAAQEKDTLLFNRSAEKRAQNAAEGFAVTGDYTEVYRACETVLLGIKPQNFDEILPVLHTNEPAEKPLLVSIAAGVTFGKIERALGANTPIIRVMPNTPLMIGEGATVLVKNAAATPEQLARVRALFDTMGMTVVCQNEDMLCECIPYNGSAPAYVYAFIEGMLRSAETHGFAREEALPLVCQAVIGSAKLAMVGTKTTAERIREVCSPGGTTIEAVKVLEKRDLNGMLAEACDKCIARAYELGK